MPSDSSSTPTTSQESTAAPLVVGVGASAGGLDAFQRFVEKLPADARMGVIFILHLLPTHKSILPELLSKKTVMTVSQAAHDMPIEAGHVYVIPPDVYIEVRAGRFDMTPRAGDGGLFLPIDRFFGSLAHDAHERAVGVVLSGTGSDGAIGLRQIKEGGGITFCQSPETAEFDEMPRAAMATGDADFVMPPDEIGRTLAELAGHAYLDATRRGAAFALRPDEQQLKRIFTMLQTASGVDFSHYKQPTLERRLLRRMALHKLATVAEYLDLLERQAQEINELYRDILIHVTFFFREPDSFVALAEKVFPKLFDGRRPDEPLRIWVAGCSTGEEAYSLVISLLDYLGENCLGDGADQMPVQVFATDISEGAIETARAGLYPEPLVRPVSPTRLRQYFMSVDGKYRVKKRLRDLCLFARHDLLRDPPFSRLDLVLCRNVLIYLSQAAQQRVLSLFHYALKSSGFLMLGGAETVGPREDLFAAIDKKHRLYNKRPVDQLPGVLHFADHGLVPRAAPNPSPYVQTTERLRYQSALDEVTHFVVAKYAPPGVLVNDHLEIVQFRGQTGFFLEPSPGEVSLNVLKMARPGLAEKLEQALIEARQSQASVRKEGLHVYFDGHGRDVHLEVTPIFVAGAPYFLVLFEDVTVELDAEGVRRHRRAPPADGPQRGEPARKVDELEITRRHLEAAIHDLEVTNEELQSANEEVLTSNEELQSTNEELDTAREELQSTNEELNTLNAELYSRNEELGHLNSDLVNLLSSVQLAVLLVDRALRIRRFTPAAEKLFNLIATDVGRPMQHIKTNLACPELEQLVRSCIDTFAPLEREIQDLGGAWFLLRVRPYCTLDNRIDGAVIVLQDIDTLKKHGLEIEESRRYLQAILETIREGLVVLDGKLTVQMVNSAFCRMFAVTSQDTTGKPLYELGNRQWDIPRLRSQLADILPSNSGFESFEVEHDFPRVGRKRLILNGRQIEGDDGRPSLLLLAIQEAPPAGK